MASSAARRQFVLASAASPIARQQRASPPELLQQVEAVHRSVVARHRPRHLQHHRVAPVGLGDVEPEPSAARRAGRPAGSGPNQSVRRFQRVLQRAGGGRRQREREHAARSSDRHPPRRRRQQEERVGRREQNHRQVIAEARARRRRRTQPSRANVGRCSQRSSRRSVSATSSDVQRVDLGDDRLAPERVRAGEEQRGRRRRRRPTPTARRRRSDQHAAGERRLDGRREIQRVRGIAADEPEEQRRRWRSTADSRRAA